MTEATPILPHQDRAAMTKARATLIEARRCAVLEVKADLHRRGIKPQHLALKVIRAQADAYLAAQNSSPNS